MGETRVDLLHLLEDLRDAYPGALEETILTEIIANSLDSGATRIAFSTDPAAGTFAAIDDGAGMARRDLARYHDLAASTKTRGEGIGFAGVGIKLGLLLCDEVVTETRRATQHVATAWHLASHHKAPWKWIDPPGLVSERGTGVRLKLKNPLSPLLEGGFVEATVQRHFQPLLDSTFDEMFAKRYPRGVVFEVNGRALPRADGSAEERATLAIRLGRKRKPSALGYLTRDAAPLGDDLRGVAVSTLGKVIRRGWDWLGTMPATPELVGGLIEVPALAESLTLNKADFIRVGQRGAVYLSYRKAIQEAVSEQLASWGDTRDSAEEARRRKTRPFERDLESVLVDLAEDFPLLASLVERYRGGQKKLPIGRPADTNQMVPVAVDPGEVPLPFTPEPAGDTADDETGSPSDPGNAAPPPSEASSGESPEIPPPPPASTESHADREPPPGQALMPGRSGPKRPMRYGLAIQFEMRPDSDVLGRLVESTVWVNEAHPAYRRAVAARSEGYHLALTVAMALGSLAVEPAQAQAFISAFLARWGEALDRPTRKPRRPRPPP